MLIILIVNIIICTLGIIISYFSNKTVHNYKTIEKTPNNIKNIKNEIDE
ncbi:hypothetical protein HER12_000376 [Spiroplasma platyhelix PALS-1]|nr:hypothetical protein [Spiroplasma platyhelix PALS-1]UJB29388.1 hypothetical protein SPLAT_v1c06240 [Spiroplasma platyhelix PALS-1]